MVKDLYTEWLGIEPGPRPPEYYTLLGLDYFCHDAGAIESATRARLTRLDEFAMHPDRDKRDAVQDMMNEVARARVCLINPVKRRAYDERLAAAIGVPVLATVADGPKAPAPVLPQIAQPAAARPVPPVLMPVADAAALPVLPQIAQPAAPAPAAAARPVLPEAPPPAKAEDPARQLFEARVWAHLGKWKLDPQEERLLVAEAADFGIAAKAARHIIHKIDRAAEALAEKKHKRMIGIVVGSAGVVVAGLLVFLVLSNWWTRHEREMQFTDALAAAKACLAREDWQGADQALTKAGEISPKDPRHIALGDELAAARLRTQREMQFADTLAAARTCLARDDLKGADQALVKAREIFPEDSRHIALRGELAEARLRAEREKAFVAALATAKDCLARDDLEAAGQALAKARNISSPNDPRHIALCDELAAARLRTGREREFTAALAAAKDCLARDDLEAAGQALAKARNIFPEDPRYIAVGDKFAVAAHSTFTAHLNEARSLLGSNRYADANSRIVQALAIQPGSPDALELSRDIAGHLAQEPKPPPGGALTLDLGGGVSMKLALIPAGKFVMGSPDGEKERLDNEGPQHEVTITKPFYMGVYEVTQEQYETVMGSSGSKYNGKGNPVEGRGPGVSWDNAAAFCKKASQKTGKEIRLPTEAEWEYACRAGSKTAYYFGEDASALGDYAWFDGNAGKTTHPAGQKKPNAWGLYDMYGNVFEWCADWYGPYPANLSKPDPQGPETGGRRVVRGGSIGQRAGHCRSATRLWGDPGLRSGNYPPPVGFRVAVDSGTADAPDVAQPAAYRKWLEEANRPFSSPWGGPSATSSAGRTELQKALDAVEKALAIRPADPVALALKAKIEKYLSQPASSKPAGPQPGELTLDLGGGVGMRLALIPAGKFMMGSPEDEKDRNSDEGPQHEVTISKPFYMGVFEVTQDQYEALMGRNPSRFKGALNPVDGVSWGDAVEFCRRLSQKTGKTASLPTEAQWEYACRAGSKTRFCYGDNDADLGDYAWYDQNSGSKTHPAGGKKPNVFGLYDMHGNVWEWCSDRYAASYTNAKNQDPAGPATGTYRVLRGGSWSNYPKFCRSAYRSGLSPGNRSINYGFRVSVDSK